MRKHCQPVEINISWVHFCGFKTFNTSCKSLANGNKLGDIELELECFNLVHEEVVVFLDNEGQNFIILDEITSLSL